MLAAVEALLDGPDPFGALTIDDLTYASGVSRSTFYLYFESNADFLVTLGDGTADKLPGAVGSWWSLSPGAGKGRAQAGAA